jgi:divalent metal cation (Fe/Co/Zn/Cd) transporter
VINPSQRRAPATPAYPWAGSETPVSPRLPQRSGTRTILLVTDRLPLLRRGVALEAATVGYNVLEGLVGIVTGLTAGSVALTGFGVDSLIEVTSGAVLWWRLRAELGSPPVAAAVERRATRSAGALLLLLGLYLVIESVRRIITAEHPDKSALGIAITALALIVMPLLARAKLRTAQALGSRALRADAHEAIVCAWLAFATLIGLLLNAALGWWWADPAAALAMLPLIVREGLEAVRE